MPTTQDHANLTAFTATLDRHNELMTDTVAALREFKAEVRAELKALSDRVDAQSTLNERMAASEQDRKAIHAAVGSVKSDTEALRAWVLASLGAGLLAFVGIIVNLLVKAGAKVGP